MPHTDSSHKFQVWVVVPSSRSPSAVKQRHKNVHTEKLNSQQVARQLSMRNYARLNYASPAGQSMDSVTGTRVPELDCLVV